MNLSSSYLISDSVGKNQFQKCVSILHYDLLLFKFLLTIQFFEYLNAISLFLKSKRLTENVVN